MSGARILSRVDLKPGRDHVEVSAAGEKVCLRTTWDGRKTGQVITKRQAVAVADAITEGRLSALLAAIDSFDAHETEPGAARWVDVMKARRSLL